MLASSLSTDQKVSEPLLIHSEYRYNFIFTEFLRAQGFMPDDNRDNRASNEAAAGLDVEDERQEERNTREILETQVSRVALMCLWELKSFLRFSETDARVASETQSVAKRCWSGQTRDKK